MNKENIIQQTEDFVKNKLMGEGSGHDWWHVFRVWKTAIAIAKQEKSDLFIVELGALLHDVADWKFHGGDDLAGGRVAQQWLESLGVEKATIDHVCAIVNSVSFKGAGVPTPTKTIEAAIVQDADRLDAIGAIGIARAFAYGGHKGRELYNPAIKPEEHASFEQYKKNTGTTINHFYEKLLLLKNLMNTATAKNMAEKRHSFMEKYLDAFFEEWNGGEDFFLTKPTKSVKIDIKK